MRFSSAGMEVAPSGDQDLRIAAGRVVRQTEVTRLVINTGRAWRGRRVLLVRWVRWVRSVRSVRSVLSMGSGCTLAHKSEPRAKAGWGGERACVAEDITHARHCQESTHDTMWPMRWH